MPLSFIDAIRSKSSNSWCYLLFFLYLENIIAPCGRSPSLKGEEPRHEGVGTSSAEVSLGLRRGTSFVGLSTTLPSGTKP